MAAVHHRASRHRCLPPTASTFPGRAISLQRPALAGATRGADEALRPTTFRQIMRTRFLIAKAGVKRLTGHRSVVFPSGWHGRNNTGTSPIGKPYSTTSCAAGSKGISLLGRYLEMSEQNVCAWSTLKIQCQGSHLTVVIRLKRNSAPKSAHRQRVIPTAKRELFLTQIEHYTRANFSPARPFF